MMTTQANFNIIGLKKLWTSHFIDWTTALHLCVRVLEGRCVSQPFDLYVRLKQGGLQLAELSPEPEITLDVSQGCIKYRALVQQTPCSYSKKSVKQECSCCLFRAWMSLLHCGASFSKILFSSFICHLNETLFYLTSASNLHLSFWTNKKSYSEFSDRDSWFVRVLKRINMPEV